MQGAGADISPLKWADTPAACPLYLNFIFPHFLKPRLLYIAKGNVPMLWLVVPVFSKVCLQGVSLAFSLGNLPGVHVLVKIPDK